MIKAIDEKAVEQELKETKKRINEIEKKELKDLRKKSPYNGISAFGIYPLSKV